MSSHREPPEHVKFIAGELSHFVRYVEDASYLDLVAVHRAAELAVRVIEAEMTRRRS